VAIVLSDTEDLVADPSTTAEPSNVRRQMADETTTRKQRTGHVKPDMP
jgi:hypothetical protein